MNNNFNNNLAISFQGKNKNKLYMYYENAELCLAVDNYDPNYTYCIMRDDLLYVPMKKIFQQLQKTDAFRYLSTNRLGNKFEWISEGHGVPEAQNRLIIHEMNGIFTINFLKSKYNCFDAKDICSVHFSLFNSKNKIVTELFNQMYVNAYNQMLLTRNSLLK